jgi:hypothetical protein
MKKIVFSLIAIVSFTLMSFSDTKSNVVYENEFNTIEIQIVEVDDFSLSDEVNCKWRTCYVYSDGSMSCGEWTYGKCDKDGNGKLTPIPN